MMAQNGQDLLRWASYQEKVVCKNTRLLETKAQQLLQRGGDEPQYQLLLCHRAHKHGLKLSSFYFATIYTQNARGKSPHQLQQAHF